MLASAVVVVVLVVQAVVDRPMDSLEDDPAVDLPCLLEDPGLSLPCLYIIGKRLNQRNSATNFPNV